MTAHLPFTSSMFADLRGVTVRNTFLEFEDCGRDELAPESGFLRQASEPAKPFGRQVSEQTTAGSGMTMEDARNRDFESTTEPDDGFHGLPYLASQLPVFAAAAAGGLDLGQGQLPNITTAALQAALAMAVAPTQTQVHAAGPQMLPRFCPNCGSEAELNHRFCPFCCFLLQPVRTNGLATAGPKGPLQPSIPTVPEMGPAGTSPPAQGLLQGLRRFRFVEANPHDVELARRCCLGLLHGRTV